MVKRHDSIVPGTLETCPTVNGGRKRKKPRWRRLVDHGHWGFSFARILPAGWGEEGLFPYLYARGLRTVCRERADQ